MSSVLDQEVNGSSGRWTKEQHHKFIQGLELYGRNWKQISKLIKTRNGAQIRSHAQKYFERLQKTDEKRSNTSETLVQKTSSSTDLSSAPEQVPNVINSYFSVFILKYLTENREINFWNESFDFGDRNLTVSSNDTLKLKQSFTEFELNKSVVWTKGGQLSLNSQL